MSYMYLILAKDGDPNLGLRLMDVPVEWRDGRFVVTGKLQDRPATDRDLWSMLDDGPADAPMDDVPVPDGWSRMTYFWQPARYVPESAEVRSQGRRDAVQKMVDLGLATPADAKRLLEDTDG